MPRRVSVVVPTIDEPDELRGCFERLVKQTYDPFDVLVVDSGTGTNQRIVDAFADRLDVEMDHVPKHGLPRARNNAISKLDDTDVVAFCDPDARPVPEWIEALVEEYGDSVGAVGGPVLEPGENLQSRDEVGVVRSNGEIIANFDADRRTPVEHLRGTNMSFALDVLRELGGFDPAYAGTAHFEDTDATYKVHRAGYDVVYTPDASIEHHHPIAERNRRAYYRYMMANWPVLFEKTKPTVPDRLSFYARWTTRKAYYSARIAYETRLKPSLGAYLGVK